MSSWSTRWKSLGPGLLWAGAAIGVSHLVQSTRAGASYGFALVWVVVVANLFKYAAFEFGPRYAAATGESLLDGYLRVGRWAMVVFLIMTFGTMFAIQAAVTVVTAGLAANIFGLGLNPVLWSAIILALCVVILAIGRYRLLDRVIKLIIILLTVSTLVAVAAAIGHGSAARVDFLPPRIWTIGGVSFLVALMGWMPSAIDISVWHSLWTLEKGKEGEVDLASALFDFRLGYFGTALLAMCFLTLGALVMYGTGNVFSSSGAGFAGQFIDLYVSSLGGWSRPVVAIAALTTMLSTTLTVTDAFPRVLQRSTQLVLPRLQVPGLYWIWMGIVTSGSLLIIGLYMRGMTLLVDLATTLSFLTAPILAYINYRAVTGPWMPAYARPGSRLRLLNWLSIAFLGGFSLFFLFWRFILN